MRCRLCGAKTACSSPPAAIRSAIGPGAVVRVRVCTNPACLYSWTTIERDRECSGRPIAGARIRASESYGVAQRRVRVIDGSRIETWEEAKDFQEMV